MILRFCYLSYPLFSVEQISAGHPRVGLDCHNDVVGHAACLMNTDRLSLFIPPEEHQHMSDGLFSAGADQNVSCLKILSADLMSQMDQSAGAGFTEGRAEGAPPVPRQPSGAVKSPEDSSLVIRSDEGAEMILVIIRRGSLAAEVIWNAAYAAQGVFRQPPAVFAEILRKQLQIGFDL